MNVGIGYGYLSGDFASSPLVNLSSFIRLSPRSYFITENFYIGIEDEFLLLLSLGGRSIINRISLDYGLFMPFYPEMDIFIAFPWLGITIPLHKAKLDSKQ